MKPLISVIMPVYNAEKYLREAISSILDQTVSDFELIILNDASTDSSEEIIYSFKDRRIIYVLNKINLGLIGTLNKGIELAQGMYIARMDNDDISDPKRFEIQLDYLEKDREAGMVCSPIIGITSAGKERDHWPADFQTRTSGEIAARLPYENCISHPTVMLEAGLLKKYRYASNQQGSEDWDLWLRLVRDGIKIIKTNEVLLRYRIHEQSITSAYRKKRPAQLKAAAVKLRFAVASLSAGRLNPVVFKALFSVARNVGYHFKMNILPAQLRNGKWLLTINPLQALSQYTRLVKCLKENETGHFFFFPYSHIGGAEKVHAQISKLAETKRPLVFITGINDRNAYAAQFGDKVLLLNVGKTLYHPFFSRRSEALIRSKILAGHPVLFGSNNRFYYDLIVSLPPHIYAVDLVHDYNYRANAAEAQKYLPAFLRCQKRIFISNAAIGKTLDFYEKNFVDDEYAQRINLIYNAVDVPLSTSERKWCTPYKILYVGRDTSEKRVDIIEELAEQCLKENLPFRFILVGDLSHRGKLNSLTNTELAGLVLDEKRLAGYYAAADFIIISSDSEGFPLSLAEGMARGCIPFSTPVGDIPFHIKNGFNGIVIDSVDREKAVTGFMAELKKIAEEKYGLPLLSANACEYARATFSREVFNEAYRAVLRLN
jgi:glycosyltransferase involved in cell wall biosynthesis